MTMFREIKMIDYSRPLAKRAATRKVCGPYTWAPSRPGSGRGFYSSSADALVMGDSTMRLRLEEANEHLAHSRMADVTGYYCDSDGMTTLQPIIARLPRGRGFLAGWTMGEGMAASLESTIYAEPDDAARAAHSIAENDAERERDADARFQEEYADLGD